MEYSEGAESKEKAPTVREGFPSSAKFKFRGNGLIMLLVVLAMIVPHETLRLSFTMHFQYFDFGGLAGILREDGTRIIPGILQIFGIGTQSLLNTFWPILIISASGLAFKNGLYIFMMRQFFRGVPDELEESAYVDGATTMRTFFNIILPLVVVYLFCQKYLVQGIERSGIVG